MTLSELYNSNPRDYAMMLLEDEGVDATTLLLTCIKFMSAQDVKDALDDNELSPRFRDDKDEEVFTIYVDDEISSEERNACDHYNERYVTPYYD